MKLLLRCLILLFVCAGVLRAEPKYPDRWVWVFGWGLGSDGDVTAVNKVLEDGAKHGINGACVSFGLDHLEGKPPEFFERLARVQKRADELGVEIIPTAYSVGYGGGFLGHNKYLAEGLPVRGSLYVAKENSAYFVSEVPPVLRNGGFEEFRGNKCVGFNFCDDPGVVSFADTQVFHGGKSSMRLENFASNEHGHGRVNQEVKVKPFTAYRFEVWLKSEGLENTGAFNVQVLANGRALAPRSFGLKPTEDWRKLSLLFNSATNERVSLYAGMWGGRGGKLWVDDWTLEEEGPAKILRRPGTPVRVTSDDGSQVFEEGRDFARFEDSAFSLWRSEKRDAVRMKLLSHSRIKDGDRLRVDWYHPMLINDSQVTCCMAEPEIYEILDRETKLLGAALHPKRVMLGFDEIRMGGTCEACRGKDMAKLLGECTTRAADLLKKNIPGVKVLVWSDMFDPNHNARDNFYLVEGSYAGSWKYIPKDMEIAIWGGGLREKSLNFFDEQGFKALVACYYDADNLNDVKDWIDASKKHTNITGFMYTPWSKKYGLLGEFGDLLTK